MDKTQWKKHKIIDGLKVQEFLTSSKWTEMEKPYFCNRNTTKHIILILQVKETI